MIPTGEHPDLDAWQAAAERRNLQRRGRSRIWKRLRLVVFAALFAVLIAASIGLAKTAGPDRPIVRATSPRAATQTQASRSPRAPTSRAPARAATPTRAAAPPLTAPAHVIANPDATLPLTGAPGVMLMALIGSSLTMLGMLTNALSAPVRRQRS